MVIALGVLSSAIWDGVKLISRLAWARRKIAAAGVGRLLLPKPDLQLKRIVAGLIVSLAVATFANALPPAVLRN
jgi:hypothetical protein